MGGFLPLGDVFWLSLGSFSTVLDFAAQLLLPRWYFPAGLCYPLNFLAGSFLLVFWAAGTLLALVLPINFLAVVFSDLFWAALPRCWASLPNKLPRGGVFRLSLGSFAAVLALAAQ